MTNKELDRIAPIDPNEYTSEYMRILLAEKALRTEQNNRQVHTMRGEK